MKHQPLQLAILKAAALLVPGQERKDWLQEWAAELCHVQAANPRMATAFCLGAFKDAFYFRSTRTQWNPGQILNLKSPHRCAALLALLAAASLITALSMPATIHRSPLYKDQFLLRHALLVAIALITLPATTSLRLGDYSTTSLRRLARWTFLAIKITLLVIIVFCGTVTLLPPMIQGNLLLAGYVLSIRWALIDQRQRCPVCLHSLTNPTRIGAPSQTFLAWYGTELICTQGHGLLYVSEIDTSCCSTHRWQYLDSSWSGLFLTRAK